MVWWPTVDLKLIRSSAFFCVQGRRKCSTYQLQKCFNITWYKLLPPSTLGKDFTCINTMRPRKNGHNLAEYILKFISVYDFFIIQISQKFAPKGQIDNKPSTPNWRQTIIWTNDGLVLWGLYASLGPRWFQEGFLPRLNTPVAQVLNGQSCYWNIVCRLEAVRSNVQNFISPWESTDDSTDAIRTPVKYQNDK